MKTTTKYQLKIAALLVFAPVAFAIDLALLPVRVLDRVASLPIKWYGDWRYGS